MKKLLLFFLLIYLSSPAKATIYTSVAPGGSWSAPETWDQGSVPGCGDTIFITTYVEITTSQDYDPPQCSTPMYITITAGGTLNFDSGKKLVLACGSGVTVEAGGSITSDGGGASENIKICDVTVWQGSDGDIITPTVLGSGLPIELLSFEGTYSGNGVDLSWTTASETNNDYFTLERCGNGVNFEPIAIIDGAGNSNTTLQYQYTDSYPLSGINYYRLKQTDFSGQFSYSHIESVDVGSLLTSELNLYPNPNDGNFQLQINGEKNESYVLVIRDISGKEQFSRQIYASGKNHLETIYLNNELNAGTYLITVTSTTESGTRKLVIR
jgi:hypothetical protein